MFRRILIANRGEVVSRIIRTCNRMGIETVVVTSSADRDLAYLSEATEVAEIGGVRSYLDMDAIIDAAKRTRCAAIHPGWGFLSENPIFAARCEAVGITFIGPSPGAMRQMADKSTARETMTKLGLFPIPGWSDKILSLENAFKAAEQIGYPLLLKAVSGGGGRGMRQVHESAQLESAFQSASAEAQSAFGDPALYAERLITGGRHIEFQVLSDGLNAVVVGARECSMQRRHQKLLEETPSVAVTEEQYKQLSKQIEQVCVALKYRGAGTVEMLRDQDGEIWFMEMNTRLQVEHTITEELTGIDLVEQQLRIAANQPLKLSVESSGHSIQCRINAEDVSLNFRPSPGQITKLKWATGDGIRIDSHLCEGDKISPHYDSMVAKVIVHGQTRLEAIERMKYVLCETKIEGVPTTIPLHLKLLEHPQFQTGNYDTKFVERHLEDLI